MDYNLFLEKLKKNLQKTALKFGKEYSNQLVKSGENFAQKSKKNIEEWIKAANSGKLSRDDLKWLLASEDDLAQMEVLKEKGLALAQKDKLREAFVNSIIDTVFQMIP